MGGSEATQSIAGIVVIEFSMRVFVPLLGLPQSSNPEWGTINVNTPIAQALLGAAQGATVEAKLPMGKIYLLIEEIKRTKH